MSRGGGNTRVATAGQLRPGGTMADSGGVGAAKHSVEYADVPRNSTAVNHLLSADGIRAAVSGGSDGMAEADVQIRIGFVRKVYSLVRDP